MIINIYENPGIVDELDNVIDNEAFDSVIDYDEYIKEMNTEKVWHSEWEQFDISCIKSCMEDAIIGEKKSADWAIQHVSDYIDDMYTSRAPDYDISDIYDDILKFFNDHYFLTPEQHSKIVAMRAKLKRIEKENECHFSEVEDLVTSVNEASSFKDLKSAVVDILDKVEELDANSFGDLEHLQELDDKTDDIENDIKKVKAQLEEYRILKSDISNLRIELENLRSVLRGTARDWNDISKKVDEQGTILNNLTFETKFNSNAIVSHCLNHGSANEKKLYSWVPKDYDFNSKDRVNRYEKWKKENGLDKKEKDDNVNHPKHYTQGKYEVIDFIHEYGKNVNVGNSIKYISRAGVKDEDKYVEDLEKALWYLHDYNNPKPKQHIDPVDYTKDKKLPDELMAVIIDICKKDYKLAEVNLSDYIKKLKDDANNG